MLKTMQEVSLKSLDMINKNADGINKLAEREIEKRPEGAKLKQLKELKLKALDVVMESGTPDTLAIALDQVSKKIGLTWNTDVQALPNFKQAG